MKIFLVAFALLIASTPGFAGENLKLNFTWTLIATARTGL